MFHFPVRLIVLVVFSVTIIDSARITSASDKGDFITNHENKQELSGVDHVGGVVNNSSENSLIDGVTKIIGNIEFPEDDGIIQVYVGNADDLSGSGEDGDGERDSVDNQTSSKAGQLSGADIKETSEALINQSSNRNETERISDRSVKYFPISPKGKLNLDAGINLTSENPELVSEVQVEDFMKSRVAYHNAILTDINDTKNMPDTFTLDSEDTKHESLGNLEMLTVEETNGNVSSGSPNEDIYVSTLQNRKANLDTTLDNHKSLDNIEDDMTTIKGSDQIKDTENMAAKQVTENSSNYNISESLLTTDTTSEQSTTIVGENTFKSINRYDKNTSNFPVANTSVTFSSQNTSGEFLSEDEIETEVEKIRLNVSDTVVDDSVNSRPVAERLYAFKTDKEKQTDTFNNKLEDPIDRNHKSITYQPLRDYKDISEEDLIEIQNLLPDQPTFKKEKIEPGVLFEECIGCDFRVLPIRPSQQRDAPKVEEESLPSPTIRFPDLPEGRALQIYSLGLSDGFFLFGYLSEFLSWIQPNEFPVDLLRDALRSQITWISLITQSLQLEAGFVACLVVGVLLALAVPVVVLSHACYRMTSREDDEIDDKIGWAGNCRRRTLVFILQILLVLLLGGMVAMFITNEQLSDAVVKSSDVIQTSLSDVSAFVHNSHLQLHFLVTQSLDQALQSVYADLDNVDSLLGRPIQQELVRETGIDVALESLSDLTREAKQTTQQVDSLMDEVRVVQEMVMSTRDKLSDLKQQVELFRRACGPRDRALCDTIDASGLDVTLRLDRLKSDERLHRMRRMGGVGLEAAVAEAKERFMSVPTKVETDTRDAREAARRQLMRQRADVEDRSLAMERLVRDMTGKVNEAKYQAGFWMQDLDQFEYWRWIICMGGGAVVMMVWTLLLCSLCCGCCGSEKAAGPTILITIVLVCLLSTALWSVALVGMLFGGHGEVFVCRPLYDEPEYHVISRLVDQPGVFYSEPRGGFIANVLYANDTLDVPIRQVLEECKENHGIYPTLGLGRVFDVEAAVDQHRWTPVSTQLRSIRANLSSLQVLSPVLQDQLSDLLATLSVNFTEHRIQMSRPATGKDMDSFSRQLDNVGNQMRDLAVASRMETLSSRTRRLIDSHIRPLEGRKDALVYQLTALEVQTGPLQRQVNQSLSHLKTIQFFINSQGEAIAQRKSRQYVDRLLSYVNQLRSHVVDALSNSVAPCRPLWDIFNTTRLFLCRHTMDPLNGFWFASMWCLIVLLMATPVCLKLVDYYRAQRSMSSGGPSENLMISEQGAAWSSPGYDIKYSKDQCNGNNHYE